MTADEGEETVPGVFLSTRCTGAAAARCFEHERVCCTGGKLGAGEGGGQRDARGAKQANKKGEKRKMEGRMEGRGRTLD